MVETGQAKEKNVIRDTDDGARRLAKEILRSARYGAIAALEAETGWPLASRVAVAADMDGTPVILISSLSSHTAALDENPCCSLLLGEPGKGDPLAHPRMTVFCRAQKMDRLDDDLTRVRRRYLEKHPKAALYADFGDFAFYRLAVERANLNGGFGKAYTLMSSDLILNCADWQALADWEAGAVGHMNEDHLDAVKLYAEVLLKQPEGKWRLTSIDPEGFDLLCGDSTARFWFEQPLASPDHLRSALVDLAIRARAVSSDNHLSDET